MSDPASRSESPLSLNLRINEACDRFELAWQAGQRPRIEEYLGDTCEPERSALVRELIALDIDYRRQVGEQPRAEDYHERFPSLEQAPALSTLGGSRASALPQRLGDFEIHREIARGGMGVVYEARQVSLNRRVALKMLNSGLGLTPKAVQRFRREAEAAAKLHHTNIVPVYATGEEQGSYFYVMELIEGPSLDRVIRQMRQGPGGAGPAPAPSGAGASVTPDLVQTGPYVESSTASGVPAGLSSSSLGSGGGYFDTVARLIAEVADALEYAHQQGVIHRDIKPSNLLLSPVGRLSVNDFGLARMVEQPGMTMTGEFVGSPLYMSPEQIAAGRAPLDHRTDIYSLGATLYELLRCNRRFAGSAAIKSSPRSCTRKPCRPSGSIATCRPIWIRFV
jgi:serine/threonine protein kinase